MSTQPWRNFDTRFDPQESSAEKAAGVALAMFIGFALAMALVSWWSS